MWLIVSLVGIFIRGYLYHSFLPLNQLFLPGARIEKRIRNATFKIRIRI